MPADAVLLLTETDLDWTEVREHVGECPLLVAAENRALTARFEINPDLSVIDIDPAVSFVRASTS